MAVAVAICLLALSVPAKPNNSSNLARQAAHYEIGYAPSAATLIERAETTHYYQNSDDDTPSWCTALKRPEWWLVILGFPSLAVLLWQATETRRATQATMGYVRAFIESQRPVLTTHPHGNPFADLMDKDTPRVQLALVNKGQTTAYECTYDSWIEMLPIPPTAMDFTSNADHASVAERFSLAPNSEPMVINIPFTKGLSDADRLDLGHARRTAHVRLRVTFRDAFSANRRYADFGFYVMYQSLGILPKYHDSN